MVYDITTNGARDENSQMRNQLPINSSQNIGLSVQEFPSKNEYPPFVDQVHGLSLALLAKSRKLKTFWWLVFFACTICGILTTVSVMIEYIRAPTATSIAIKRVPSLELPAITVCPNTPDALNYGPLFNHIQTRLPDITNETAIDLISFWLAGSGLGFIQRALTFTETRLVELAEMFKIWSDGYDTQSFFYMIQNEYGYKCEQLFEKCYFNGMVRDRCKGLFRPIWAPRLGLCYQTRRNTNQTEDNDYLDLYLIPPPSITGTISNLTKAQRTFTQTVLIAYVNDNFEHVIPSRSLYLYPNELNKLNLNARLVELQEHPQDCTNKIVGKDASCFVNKWLISNLLDPFNCTLPYLKVPGISNSTKICDPLTIVKNYTMITSYRNFADKRCIPGCTKWEYGRERVNRVARENVNPEDRFHLAVGFDELQYEHVREFSTISISGLISQVGGQLGLYLGLSIITLFQIVIYSVNAISRFLCRLLRPLPVGPEINQNEMHRVGNGRLRCNHDISSYV